MNADGVRIFCAAGHNVQRRVPRRGFTLMELMVVVAVIITLAGLVIPALNKARDSARAMLCGANARQMGLALAMYTDDHHGLIFPLKEEIPAGGSEGAPGGTLWWFGFEASGGPTAEGSRVLDRTRGRLWPYYTVHDTIEVCPAFRTDSPDYKPKFTTNWTTYGLPLKFMSPNAPTHVRRVKQPWKTVAFADSAQINTFQPPASPTNPMFEQWYYIAQLEQTVHYVHGKRANFAMFDGHVERVAPDAALNLTFPEAPVGTPPQSVVIQLP